MQNYVSSSNSKCEIYVMQELTEFVDLESFMSQYGTYFENNFLVKICKKLKGNGNSMVIVENRGAG